MMHSNLESMLKLYDLRSEQDYTNALKEIIQEIALLGLWRAKFYEKAAFYGGSALRILYQLNRFSEDLDFSLLTPNPDFKLRPYHCAIRDELEGFGFEVEVSEKLKPIESQIESAFIKANTQQYFILIQAPQHLIQGTHAMRSLKIKMEVDVNPPGHFSTEVKTLLHPIPFSVRTYQPADLFAGKLHALLCRPWKARIKGRDWYDFVWYIGQNIPVHLTHLQARLIQTQHCSAHQPFTASDLNTLLIEKINSVDFSEAKKDILPFIKDTATVDVWSQTFFLEILNHLKTL